ncbi:hypothetical protein CL633_03295 [bacterium]|nr:hypothetical protein [bacterium]
MTKKTFKPILIFCFTIILVFGVAQSAWASWNPFSTGNLIDGLLNLVNSFLNLIVVGIVGVLAVITGELADWAIGYNTFVNSPFVQAGWTIVRDLVNVSFIFILLTIAFGTILRMPNYTIKRLLPKLIAIALLVNFSKMLCGMMIDATQILTHFFLDAMGSGGIGGASSYTGNSLTGKIMGGLSTANIFNSGGGIEGYGVATSPAFLVNAGISMIIGAVFNIIVMLITALVFALLAGFYIIRIFVLWFCIILSPAAFICLIIPNLKKYWDKWWNTFLNYAIYGPITAFFLYLVMISIDKKEQFTDATGVNLTAGAAIGNAFWTGGHFFFYIIVIGLLIGSVIMGKQLGIMGAAAVVGAAKKQGNALKKYAWQKTKEPVESRLGQKAAGWSEKMHLKGMDKGGIKGWMMQQAARVPRKYAGKTRADSKKLEDSIKNMTSDEMKQEIQTASAPMKVKMMETLANRGDLDADKRLGFTADKIEEYTKSMPKHQGDYKKVLKSHLNLAPEIDEFVQAEQNKENAKAKEENRTAQTLTSDDIIEKMIWKLKPGDMGAIADSSIILPGQKDAQGNVLAQGNVVYKKMRDAFVKGKLKNKHLARAAISDNVETFEKLKTIAEVAAQEAISFSDPADAQKTAATQKRGQDLSAYIKNSLDNALGGQQQQTTP